MNTIAQAVRRTRRPTPLVPPLPLILLHRWLGIGVGFLFALWFASGAVLSLVPFPSLPTSSRIARSEPIDFERVTVPPADALTEISSLSVESLRLISVQGQPRYVLSLADGAVLSISAESGKLLGPVPANTARAVAESFNGRPATEIVGPFDYDQWVVHDQYDGFRPFYRVALADGRGTRVYVSTRSGEVLQQTRRTEREWNYAGSVVHWFNVVALRRHKDLWRWVMLPLAGICGLLACAGLTLGVMHLVNARRMRRRGLSPFRSWLRWHHTIGLFASMLLLSWIVSGCLMLDDGTVFPSDQPTAMEIAGFRGMTLMQAAGHFPLATLRRLPRAREVEVTAVAGTPYLSVRNGAQTDSWVATRSPRGDLSVSHTVPDFLLLAAVRRAWPSSRIAQIRDIPSDDAYQVLSDPLPLTARRITLGDQGRTWIQVDSATGQILSVTDSRIRAKRWWVNGLHDFDFPLLDRSKPLRLLVLMSAVTAGFIFSCTGLVVGMKRLARQRR